MQAMMVNVAARSEACSTVLSAASCSRRDSWENSVVRLAFHFPARFPGAWKVRGATRSSASRSRRASIFCQVSDPSSLSLEGISLSPRWLKPEGVVANSAAFSADTEVIVAAWKILDNFNKNDIRGTSQESLASPEGLNALAASVVVASQAALKADGSQPLMGVCAGDRSEAISALQQWTQALGCDMVSPRMLDEDKRQAENLLLGPVYVKYSAKSKLCYLTPYQGSFRGVILQIGQRQVGHLPLFLFDPSTFQGLE